MNYVVPILFLLASAGAASFVIYGIAKGPGELCWVASPFVLCLLFLIMGGMMLHWDQKWAMERKYERTIGELEQKHRKEQHEAEIREARAERERRLQELESQAYAKDVSEHGQQIALLKRIERRLEREEK